MDSKKSNESEFVAPDYLLAWFKNPEVVGNVKAEFIKRYKIVKDLVDNKMPEDQIMAAKRSLNDFAVECGFENFDMASEDMERIEEMYHEAGALNFQAIIDQNKK